MQLSVESCQSKFEVNELSCQSKFEVHSIMVEQLFNALKATETLASDNIKV